MESATKIDDLSLAQALLRLTPDDVETHVRPIAPELADCIQAHRSAENAKHAQRMYAETMREIDRVNAERTRLLAKDRLRMLLLVEDRDIARLAAAEILSREPASNRTIPYANGGLAEIGVDETGTVYARINPIARSWDYWLPPTGRA
jgi:hypothetical protein